MRALSLKYGECTTEIYKDEDNIINTEQINDEYKETDKIVEFYGQEFQEGNLEIISQWVEDECTITVDFASFRPCVVKYEFTGDTEEPVTEEE